MTPRARALIRELAEELPSVARPALSITHTLGVEEDSNGLPVNTGEDESEIRLCTNGDPDTKQWVDALTELVNQWVAA